jgi:putative endonuclease
MEESVRRRGYLYGLYAEAVAGIVMVAKGYTPVAWRYRTPVGEIDWIFSRRGELVFVEVKARKDLSTAMESLTARMRARIMRAAMAYLQRNPARAACAMRFDLFALSSPFRWTHLDNAWQANT